MEATSNPIINDTQPAAVRRGGLAEPIRAPVSHEHGHTVRRTGGAQRDQGLQHAGASTLQTRTRFRHRLATHARARCLPSTLGRTRFQTLHPPHVVCTHAPRPTRAQVGGDAAFGALAEARRELHGRVLVDVLKPMDEWREMLRVVEVC